MTETCVAKDKPRLGEIVSYSLPAKRFERGCIVGKGNEDEVKVQWYQSNEISIEKWYDLVVWVDEQSLPKKRVAVKVLKVEGEFCIITLPSTFFSGLEYTMSLLEFPPVIRARVGSGKITQLSARMFINALSPDNWYLDVWEQEGTHDTT